MPLSFRHLLALRDDDRGTATVEFALVFPLALFLCLVLLQTTLLMVGNLFVHYAAFAATRAAMTQIPRDLSGDDAEAMNVMAVSEGSPKFRAVKRAAAFAVMPVSGRLKDGSAPTDAFVAGLVEHHAAMGQSVPNWVNTLAAARLRYALANTQVTLVRTDGDGDTASFEAMKSGLVEFGPREAITMRVEHRLYLSVPYVSTIFADGELESQNGSGRYALIAAQYTLTNEGIPMELPPPPALPRDP